MSSDGLAKSLREFLAQNKMLLAVWLAIYIAGFFIMGVLHTYIGIIPVGIGVSVAELVGFLFIAIGTLGSWYYWEYNAERPTMADGGESE